MNSKKISFIMPIYPPHFHLANRFINSFIRCGLNTQSDIVLVFSSIDDEVEFLKEYGGGIAFVVLYCLKILILLNLLVL